MTVEKENIEPAVNLLTVAELIEKLKTFPPDLLVSYGDETGRAYVFDAKIETVAFPYLYGESEVLREREIRIGYTDVVLLL